jgi:phage/plasmid-associated DNA primase
MYGAMLFPVFPHIFLLHGPSGCGKTTVMFPITDCLHKSNIAHVEPHEFGKSFILTSMAGKLVNVVTDISKNIPIDDANLKKIEDMTPVRMDRKYLDAVDATLPFVHVFGANSVPPSREASGAHGRRWTFIKMGAWRLDEKSIYDREYGHAVFKHCPSGVLNFAREGILDLIERNGIYTIFESSSETIEEMREGADPVLAFLRQLKEGKLSTKEGYGAELIEGAQCTRNELWHVFNSWQKEFNTQPKWLSSHSFFVQMAEHSLSGGIGVKRTERVRLYVGIKVTNSVDNYNAANGAEF